MSHLQAATWCPPSHSIKKPPARKKLNLVFAACVIAGTSVSNAVAQVGTDYVESQQCSAYATISGDPGAVLLGTVSACDDCTELVALPFTFNWYGDTAISAVRVSSNGQININSGDTSSNCCSADAVEVGGAYTQPRIAVAQEDIDPGDYGDVYALDTGSSFIVDFAGTAFFANAGELNAQVELFPNGDVEVRWGFIDAAGNALAAGVEDDTRAPPAATPATGAGFTGAPGVALDGSLLSNQCRRFTAQAQAGAIDVPTLSEWASLLLVVLLAMLGVSQLRRREA